MAFQSNRLNSVRYGLFLAAGLCLPVFVFAQADTFRLRAGDTLLLDNLGQVYRWSLRNGAFDRERSVNRLAGRDTLRYRYQNVRLGRVQSVDLTDPLRPLLFYGDAQRVIWLDRSLVELRGLDLIDLNFGAIDAVAYAPNEGLWVYAPDRQQLLQIDRQGRVAYASPDLSQAFGRRIRATELVATPQQLSLATSDGRILFFDPFGSYRTQLLRAGHHLIATQRQLLFREDGTWWSYRGAGSAVEPVRSETNLVSARGGVALYRNGRSVWLTTIR